MGISGEGLTEMDSTSWYVIQTKSQQESRAECNLKTLPVETFVPKIRQRSGYSLNSKPSYSIKPLFARYLFARFKASELLHKVSFTRGVKSVVSFGGLPTAVADEIVEFLRKQSDDDECLRIGEELRDGDRVLINNGPFRNLVGVVEGKTNESQRISILLTAVSLQSRLILDREIVKKLA